jgi:hypothetical protein
LTQVPQLQGTPGQVVKEDRLPRKLSRLQRLLTGAGIGVLVAVGLPATAGASTPCDVQDGTTTQAFAQFGDYADYFLAPGGDFEGPLTWARGGTPQIVDGNNPFMLTGSGEHALHLGKDDAVTTPKLCVSRDLPHLRFVAKSSGSGQLDVEVRVYDSRGQVTDSSSGGVSPSDHRSWAPSDPVLLKTDSFRRSETGYVSISFKSQGDWLIDDVLIDPYRR